MGKYTAPELSVSTFLLTKDIAVNVGSNVWFDDEELDENGNPIVG